MFRSKLLALSKRGQEFPIEILARQTTIVSTHVSILVARDISLRKEAEKERDRMQGQLLHTSKLASIGTIAAGVAHEINNPLAIISGLTSLMHSDIQALQNGATDRAEGMIKSLKKQEIAIARIVAIVSGLRTFARTDTEHIQPIDLHQTLLETTALIQTMFDKAGVILELNLKATSPTMVMGNIGKFQQVFFNTSV